MTHAPQRPDAADITCGQILLSCLSVAFVENLFLDILPGLLEVKQVNKDVRIQVNSCGLPVGNLLECDVGVTSVCR